MLNDVSEGYSTVAPSSPSRPFSPGGPGTPYEKKLFFFKQKKSTPAAIGGIDPQLTTAPVSPGGPLFPGKPSRPYSQIIPIISS